MERLEALDRFKKIDYSTYNLYISDFWYIDDLVSGQDPDLSIISQWGKNWNPSQCISKV